MNQYRFRGLFAGALILLATSVPAPHADAQAAPTAAAQDPAAQAGIPSPAFSSSLSYYDGLRAERLPAALVQGQRDFFGAHTYKRVDLDGTFHTLWSGDRSEVEQAGSSH